MALRAASLARSMRVLFFSLAVNRATLALDDSSHDLVGHLPYFRRNLESLWPCWVLPARRWRPVPLPLPSHVR